MKKIVFLGASRDVTEDQARQELSALGPVVDVLIVRDGDPDKPLVIATMDINSGAAEFIVSRIQNRWHHGHMMTAHILHVHA